MKSSFFSSEASIFIQKRKNIVIFHSMPIFDTIERKSQKRGKNPKIYGSITKLLGINPNGVSQINQPEAMF